MRAVISVHESGHAFLAVLLMGVVPETVYCTSAVREGHGSTQLNPEMQILEIVDSDGSGRKPTHPARSSYREIFELATQGVEPRELPLVSLG